MTLSDDEIERLKHCENDDLKTLSECASCLRLHGFENDFMVLENGKFMKEMHNGDKLYRPEEVRIVSYYRFEGESDPADMSILYAMETNDGVKGTLSDAYGTYSSRRVTDFIAKVYAIRKDKLAEDDQPGETPRKGSPGKGTPCC